MRLIPSSEIACKSIGLSPTGSPSAECGLCLFCGRQIDQGDPVLVNPLKVLKRENSFMDDNCFAAPSSDMSCGWCISLMPKEAMFALRSAVVTLDGAYPLFENAHRAWLFMNPPDPPFIAGISEVNAQHLYWRTPPTLDARLISIRYGSRLFLIRRGRLMNAVEACRRAGEILTEASGGKKVIANPYRMLDREISSLSHGLFRDDALQHSIQNPELADILQFLRECNPGEIWALSSLSKTTPVVPVKPDKIQFVKTV